jgi:oligopeptidase B
MRIILLFMFLGAAALAVGCSNRPEPPRAKVVPKTLEIHGDTRTDDYFWLNQREDPEVLAYLEAENAYTEAMTAHTEALQQTLFEEIKGRIKPTDESVPYRKGDYYYYRRDEEGRDYPVYCRKAGSLDAPEQVVLDVNELAEGHGYTSVAGLRISPNQKMLAYGHDTVGRRIYTLHVLDLESGELLPDTIPDVTGNVVWAADDKTLFYTKQDLETLRWDRVYRHVLGTDPADDVLVFEETDDTFNCAVGKTKSERFIVISSYQTLSTEMRILEANDPGGDFRVFEPRRRDHEYDIDQVGDWFYVRTNLDATNFRLMRTPVARTGVKYWEEVIPHRDDTLLTGFELFRDYLVVSERRGGLIHMQVRPSGGGEPYYIEFGEPAYTVFAADNVEPDTHVLRYRYESMTTPDSTFDYDMQTREKTLLKEEEVLGGFDRENYRTERLYAPARDGVEVPISLVYRRDAMQHDGTNPLLLYGYGSYGISMNASFRSDRLSLLDRGFVYAIAHIRGGEELGRKWYEDGKLLKKKNTFTDFIDCAEYLVAEKYADPDRVFAQGGSAGGLLMGAVVNMRPDLFRGVVAAVPFVDVVTTMLDDSIPLTTGEYDEWGNPNEKEYYDYILSYSPYDQVKAQDYPAMLVLTGLHDSQVQYWEPAKWVAKLRAMKTDSNPLLLKTEMEAGHGGVSARYERYRETAFIYAFLIDQGT